MLLGFALFSPSFSNPTIPAWQLHITFMIISTQPPSSCSFFHTALKSWYFPHKQFGGHSHWLHYPRGMSGPLVKGASINLQHWVGLIPQGLLSSQDQWQVALSSKSSGGGLEPSTWAAPGAPAVIMEGHLEHMIYTCVDCRVTKNSNQRPKQIIHKRHQISTLSAGAKLKPSCHETFSTFSQIKSV